MLTALGLMLTAGAVAAAAPAPDERVVATERSASPVSAYGGRLAWSSRTASGRYRLLTSLGDTAERVPVRDRAVPFDVDLGPDRRGRTVAVYSRCRSEPREGLPFENYVEGAGCDIFEYDFRRRRERRLRGPSTRHGSEFFPAIWRARVAFARVRPRRDGARSTFADLYMTDAAGRRAHRLSGGTRGRYVALRGGRRVIYSGGPGPTRLDLRGSWVAYTWRYVPRRCGRSTDAGSRAGLDATELWIARPGARRLLERGCRSSRAFSPAFDGRTLTWLRSRWLPAESRIATDALRLGASGPRAAPLPGDRSSGVEAGAQEGAVVAYFDARPEGESSAYRLLVRSGLRFTSTRLRREPGIRPASE